MNRISAEENRRAFLNDGIAADEHGSLKTAPDRLLFTSHWHLLKRRRANRPDSANEKVREHRSAFVMGIRGHDYKKRPVDYEMCYFQFECKG